MKTICLIHHTHTDIGYTEIPGRIIERQVDFIRQAVRFAESDERFRWTCETFWAVEQFLKSASDDEKDAFIRCVGEGRIEISGSYLNYSELLDYGTHAALMRRVNAFAGEHGLRISSAMTADINGHSLAYAAALWEAGVENLFTCVHTWHGMYPLFRNQVPFYWKFPGGGRLLVWNGDHYHLGNELGLVPGAWMSHMVRDTFRPGDTNMSVAQRRMPRYLEKLDAEGYPYDFVPLMASGLMTDNAPPNPRIPDFLDEWNERNGDEIRIELSSLGDFFTRLRSSGAEIPEYEGLWPDWWADLIAAAPAATQVFREAQRMLSTYRHLSGHSASGELRAEVAKVEDLLSLYAEHTFGHSATFMHSDHLLVSACSLRKSGYAAEAFEKAQQLVDRAVSSLGAERFRAGRALRFGVVNLHDQLYEGFAAIEFDGFEWGDIDVRFDAAPPVPKPVPDVEVVDSASGTPLPSQAFQIPRGVHVVVPVRLASGAVQQLEVRRRQPQDPAGFVRVSSEQGIDGARDIRHPSNENISGTSLETESVRIEWDDGGIVSWLDKATGAELLDPGRGHNAFTPVYEVSRGAPRTPMGRNRKGANVQRGAGRITRILGSNQGPLFSTVALGYDLPGTKTCSVLIRAFVDRPLVEVEVSFHKETSADVESVYVSLPFSAGSGSELWIDTSAEPARPWKDQIPGTLTDFFLVQDGFGVVSNELGIAVSMPDSPLLQLGELDPKPRLLAGMAELEDEPMRPYAWLMNNFWETNANIDLAGFYRFRFAVMWGEALSSPAAVVRTCRNSNAGIVTFRST